MQFLPPPLDESAPDETLNIFRGFWWQNTDVASQRNRNVTSIIYETFVLHRTPLSCKCFVNDFNQLCFLLVQERTNHPNTSRVMHVQIYHKKVCSVRDELKE